MYISICFYIIHEHNCIYLYNACIYLYDIQQDVQNYTENYKLKAIPESQQ